MKTINSDIKNNTFKQVYLLTGNETFLLRSYKKRLKAALASDDLNYAYYEGKDINVNSVIEGAETLPFFAERKLIIIENSGWFKTVGAGGGNEMAEYLTHPCESTFIIFVEEEVDKRSKLYKAVSAMGKSGSKSDGKSGKETESESETSSGCGESYICEMNHPKPEEMVNWAAGMLMQNGKKITRTDLEMFLGSTGNDMELVKNEIDKLIAYTGDKDYISAEDIEAVTTVTLTNKVYDMCRAITQKKYSEAMGLYEDLLALRESPMSIIYKISRQFNQLLNVKDMINGGLKQDAVASRIKVPPFVAGKLMQQARGYDRNALLNNVEKCLELEEAFKKGDMPERLAVELLICGQ